MIRRDFQSRVAAWAVKCFGERIAVNKPTRNYRFLEEALELVQALGCSKEDALKLVRYVFNRPVGDPHQEVGGVVITLYALAAANGLDVGTAGWDELARIDTPEVIEKIRLKQRQKINEEGVLPAQVPSARTINHAAMTGGSPEEIARYRQERVDAGLWPDVPVRDYFSSEKDFREQHLNREVPSGVHLNSSGSVAVSDDYYTRTDMENCPRGIKVYLVGEGGVGTLANYDGDPFWVEWAGLPKRRNG